MDWLKGIWDWIVGKVRTFVDDLIVAIKDKVRDIIEDRELLTLCVDAIEAAIREGLTGDKAWVFARDKLVAGLKAKGRELSDCLLDTALQNAYAAYKELHS